MKRQFCTRCLRTVGTLPSGEERPYTTVERTDGRRFHYCDDAQGCSYHRSLTAFGANPERITS